MKMTKSCVATCVFIFLLNIPLWMNSLGYYSLVCCHGKSMLSSIQDGDVVLVKQGSTIKVGDVISFDLKDVKGVSSESDLVVHRVVAMNDRFLWTKGDNNKWVDPWMVPSTKVYGKAILTIPKLVWGLYLISSIPISTLSVFYVLSVVLQKKWFE